MVKRDRIICNAQSVLTKLNDRVISMPCNDIVFSLTKEEFEKIKEQLKAIIILAENSKHDFYHSLLSVFLLSLLCN